MAEPEHPAVRHERLSGGIEAARARLAERESMDWAEVGNLLDALSHELNDITNLEKNDHAAAHGHYDRIEAQLGEVNTKLDADEA